jgi:hypothetical protein
VFDLLSEVLNLSFVEGSLTASAAGAGLAL